MIRVDFSVPFGGHRLVGERLGVGCTNGTALILHGGGTSSAQGFTPLREHLAQQGIGSVVFDCIGHGRTGGAQLGTTLADRVAQAQVVIMDQRLDPRELMVAGFSMGAYVAVKLCELLPIGSLCLAIPAAYSTQALHAPFGPAFSAVIREPRSWAGSDAFDIVARYPGQLLVLSAQRDGVVPSEIPERLFDAAVLTSSRQHHVVSDAGHDLSAHYDIHPAARSMAYGAIAALCLAGRH